MKLAVPASILLLCPPGAARATPLENPAAGRPASHDDIQGYSLIQRYGTGFGGMITVRLVPVVLFKSGDLLTDLAGLSSAGGSSADRAAHPERWSRWRQSGGAYQYLKRDGSWGPIYQNKVWTSVPSAALTGRFTRTGGTGNLALGGSDAVITQSSFDFRPGGTLVREGFAGAGASVEGAGATTRVTTSGRTTPRTARYVVNGLEMTISYAEGGSERLTLMAHPTDPKILWIDGLEYIRRP